MVIQRPTSSYYQPSLASPNVTLPNYPSIEECPPNYQPSPPLVQTTRTTYPVIQPGAIQIVPVPTMTVTVTEEQQDEQQALLMLILGFFICCAWVAGFFMTRKLSSRRAKL